MKITLARSAGFCYGVRNAVYRISDALKKNSPIAIDGDLIHNPQTISVLSSRGLVKDSEIADRKGIAVAIRTHGTTKENIARIYGITRSVFNLTCPKVSRIQALIKKYSRDGYYVILAGDRFHPEIVSLQSYASSGISIISSGRDVMMIPEAEKHILISQTTIEKKFFCEVRDLVTIRFPQCLVFETICDSTCTRQSELEDALKKGADSVVVIGGRNSANTKSLASIARASGAAVHHIETIDEIKPEDYSTAQSVFITA
ncbi:MAG: 4-hydroxy-3-methylbut-2-enyl diphosphate reductase, partial [Spirochaetota bacterium]